MKSYLFKRLFITLSSLFIAFCISFLVLEYAPGNRQDFDRVKLLEAGVTGASTQTSPFSFSKFFNRVLQMAQGNMGESLTFHEDTKNVILKHTKTSLVYWSVSFTLTILFSFTLSYFACFRLGNFSYALLRNLCLFFYKIPPFLVALLLLYLANMILPTAWFKMEEPTQHFQLNTLLPHLWLPVVAYLTFLIPSFFLQLDTWIQEESNKEYLIALNARGFSKKSIFFRHLLPNVCPLFLSIFPLITRNLLVLSVAIEVTCQIHGFGFLGFLSFTTRDTPLLLTLFLFSCTLELTLILLTDILLRSIYFSQDRLVHA